MTSTSSPFIPAASRAGTAAYAPEASSARPSGDSSETRSFEELCPEEGESELPPGEPRGSDAEQATEAKAESASAPDDLEEASEDEEPEDDGHEGPAGTLAAGLVPSILQTLLAGLSQAPATGVAPQPATASARPAESAATPAQMQHGAVATATTGEARARRGAGDGAPNPAQTKPNAQAGTGTSAPAQQSQGAASAKQTGVQVASSQDTAIGPGQGETVSVTGEPLGDDQTAPAAAALSRLVGAVKHQGEKSAAQPVPASAIVPSAGQNRFLSSDNQAFATGPVVAGTRSAMPAGSMKSSTSSNAQRLSEPPVLGGLSPVAAAAGTSTETLSVDWKGWTNGGGERASTAAQFSQLGDKLSQVGIAQVQAGMPTARAATPAVQAPVPTTPALPVETAEALAPIHSAIERLVLHGREQLALTVRFEQGGSLSIKLALNHGEIATQIQTDVPGLEAALKSAWGELAQDWNSRGWKLGNPEFTSSTTTYHERHDNAADGRQGGRQARQGEDGLPDFGARAFAPARLKHAGVAPLTGLDAIRAAALARRGIHTWA